MLTGMAVVVTAPVVVVGTVWLIAVAAPDVVPEIEQ